MTSEIQTELDLCETLLEQLKNYLLQVLDLKKSSPTHFEEYLFDDERTLKIYCAFCFHVFDAVLTLAELPEDLGLEICKQFSRNYLLSEEGTLGILKPTPNIVAIGESIADAEDRDASAISAFASYATNHLVLGDCVIHQTAHWLADAILFEEILR